MKLRNKKTGEIVDVESLGHAESLKEKNGYQVTLSWATEYENLSQCKDYHSLAELNEEWEDYKPAEPLIKDEKVRKAVRAWAEMNDILFIHMCSRTRKENARIVGQNALGRTFTMEIDNEYEIRVCFKDYKECYTVAELCGEED